MIEMRDEFLSEEDLDLRNLSQDELIAYWNLWLEQAQATNDLDEALYSHGVFERDPAVTAESQRQRLSDLHGSLHTTQPFPGREVVRELVGRELEARHKT